MHKLLLVCVGICWTVSVQAQIVIGQTTGLTGSQSEAVKETAAGAKLYLDVVNNRGGINGQRIELITLDDKQDPKLAAVNARTLIVESKAVALFMTRGTPQTEAIIPILDEFDVPLVAPTTGAISLHTPAKRNVFNVRAPYRIEGAKAISLLVVMGVTKIGIVSVDDSFGSDATQGLTDGMSESKISPVFALKFDKSAVDFTALAQKIADSKPQAVIVIGSGSTAAKIMKAIRLTGSLAQLITLSNNASSGFIKELGAYAYGVVVAQVFPSKSAMSSGMSREEIRALATVDATPSMLEGFVGAKVLVEGVDAGGGRLTYSATDHTGLRFVDLSIIDKNGAFRR
jgi:branched-chain amino acid transport system substrate-binding protein